MTKNSAAKFDASRAGEYARQSRIALAGYDACHELSACMLSAAMGEGKAARVLVVGAGGTAGEIIAAARLESKWDFVAIDPSAPMLDLAREHLAKAEVSDRVETVLGAVADLDRAPSFDAAIMIGVLHHLPGDAAKQDILTQISARLYPEAPLIVAGNYRVYASQPLLMAAWAARWRMTGAGPEEVQAKMGKILQGAEPPRSEDEVISLLTGAGFKQPLRFFESLFWGAWLARRHENTK
ncbi:class I SAM-dependent methyltransferase (plasmid) [Agrobacterium tumefaciens]|uniref:Class I SAM-dependent methyltransferase n=1 Tax=Agrobacterium tumefaciens TaxID=358 RepID=A0AAP9J9J4_AGRTU|nr:class I SAM-dependent methyltransferase [Agrobacterium tumefaciens]NSZ61078.1 class I SAM-dependent methyltransferase [Agrobacterium tumefaciens]QDY97500.1 class I SAM-dependent methyltransferase [Agrobacterium tumefaciens]UXS12629.1 class I SAM-dependent methyltransferase [Agrobacterium tumefaciens]UXS19990.1 class I SAM-dependent methyltransferase [Agrobacterium tumefaciens]UXS27638.1 class I SAM-dependent methyltransferase [Agrobacterium tumefaciens]